ncbi:TetR/AcrR family transcriptional regulator [Paenibacillus sp. UNC451MF]|uniref:TetR/AcrR family transcriptional regulator n=1 Tax=Paenibacillus sp. UNC451MF TaxID=1449063 RepID=UPI00048BA1CA|nr:TetR/AcrR family transcriptional regulator [Paenibacillus sp. UNC451MF]
MIPSNETGIEHAQDERKERIKKAALKVFAERGITGTKMSMIASEAGVSQGLSYRYFESKEEIFTILVQEAMEEAQFALNNIHHLSGTPLEQIKALTIQMLDESHKYIFLLLQNAQKSEDVPVKAKEILLQYSPKETIDRLVPILTKGQQTGDFCEGDPYELLILYFSIITGLMLQEAPAKGWLNEIDRLIKILR